jgi:Fe-S-cluster containining protein
MLRLAILGDSPCDLCTAACCKQNGHEYAVLLEGEQERRRFAAYSFDVPVERDGHVSVERVLPYRAGRCAFLGDDDRCTVYEDRPMNCRRFQCVTGYGPPSRQAARHGTFLARNPSVLALLESLEPDARMLRKTPEPVDTTLAY